ncbi:MAG: hypothetical protein ACFFC7_19365 [Candidatus Hermodarchaeota archaeon]
MNQHVLTNMHPEAVLLLLKPRPSGRGSSQLLVSASIDILLSINQEDSTGSCQFMVAHHQIRRWYPLPEGSSNDLPRDRQRPITPHRGKPLFGDTFVPLFSSGPGGLTYLTDWAGLSVQFSPKYSILRSSYAPDSYQVENRQVFGEFNL